MRIGPAGRRRPYCPQKTAAMYRNHPSDSHLKNAQQGCRKKPFAKKRGRPDAGPSRNPLSASNLMQSSHPADYLMFDMPTAARNAMATLLLRGDDMPNILEGRMEMGAPVPGNSHSCHIRLDCLAAGAAGAKCACNGPDQCRHSLRSPHQRQRPNSQA